jgi:hypothetical protein
MLILGRRGIRMENEDHKFLMDLWEELKNQQLTEGQFLLKAKERVPNEEVLTFIRHQRDVTERSLGLH